MKKNKKKQEKKPSLRDCFVEKEDRTKYSRPRMDVGEEWAVSTGSAIGYSQGGWRW